jgi:hypothetical protein
MRDLLKKVKYMERHAEDIAMDRFDPVVIIRSDDDLEGYKDRIGPKTHVIKIVARKEKIRCD